MQSKSKKKLSKVKFLREMGAGCFKEDRDNRGLKIESDSGGQDYFNDAASAPPEHLVIMVNGIIGRLDQCSNFSSFFIISGIYSVFTFAFGGIVGNSRIFFRSSL